MGRFWLRGWLSEGAADVRKEEKWLGGACFGSDGGARVVRMFAVSTRG